MSVAQGRASRAAVAPASLTACRLAPARCGPRSAGVFPTFTGTPPVARSVADENEPLRTQLRGLALEVDDGTVPTGRLWRLADPPSRFYVRAPQHLVSLWRPLGRGAMHGFRLVRGRGCRTLGEASGRALCSNGPRSGGLTCDGNMPRQDGRTTICSGQVNVLANQRAITSGYVSRWRMSPLILGPRLHQRRGRRLNACPELRLQML